MVYRETQTIPFRISEYVAASANYVHSYFNAHFPMQVTFQFRDGSTSRYRYQRETNSWSYVPNSSHDARGNHIPEGNKDIDDDEYWDFNAGTGPADDINRFRWLVESFGIPVIDMRPGGSGGGGIVCVDGACYIQIF